MSMAYSGKTFNVVSIAESNPSANAPVRMVLIYACVGDVQSHFENGAGSNIIRGAQSTRTTAEHQASNIKWGVYTASRVGFGMNKVWIYTQHIQACGNPMMYISYVLQE